MLAIRLELRLYNCIISIYSTNWIRLFGGVLSLCPTAKKYNYMQIWPGPVALANNRAIKKGDRATANVLLRNRSIIALRRIPSDT